MMNLQFGRILGGLGFLLGTVLTLLAASMLQSAGLSFRGLLVGPVFMGVGVGLMLLPGAKFTPAEGRAGQRSIKDWWPQSPTVHKATWVVLGLVGAFVGNRWLGISP